MASTNTTTNLAVSSDTWLAFGLAGVCALVIGMTVGEGRWIRLAIIVAAFLLVRWPVEISLGAFVLLVPFDSVALGDSSGGRTILWFVGAAAACALIATAVMKSRLQRPPRSAMWWTIFALWCLLTSVWAVDSQDARTAVPRVLASVLLYLAAVSFRVKEIEYKRIVGLTVLGGCLAAVYVLFEFYHGMSFHEATGDTMRGSLILGSTEVNPNVLASRLLLPLALTAGAYFSATSRRQKFAYLSSSAVLVLAVLVTMSRGALLSMLVMIAVFLLRLGVNRRTLLVCGAIGAALLAMPGVFFKRLSEAAETGGAGRLDIWHVGWQLLKHYGIWGAGLGNFPATYSQYAGYASQFRGFARDPHNIYLRVAVEFGILGSVLFLRAVGAQLLDTPKGESRFQSRDIRIVACEAAGWAIMTAGIFGNLLWEKSFWLTWIMLCFTMQLYGRSRSPVPVIGEAHNVDRLDLWPHLAQTGQTRA